MTTMHPPADKRCQIYLGSGLGPDSRELIRCHNDGIRWEKWGGCLCGDPASDVCEGDFWSWECNGTHSTGAVTS